VRAARGAAKIPGAAVRAVVDENVAKAVIDAACNDYEILLRTFGEHEDVILGHPIDLSDEWWLKETRRLLP
jgi:hypothetical protein